MNPTASDRHVSTPLTAISIAYTMDQDDFVARKVFPVVPVDKQYDTYYEFSQEDFNRIQMKQRAPATESAEGVYRLSKEQYRAEVFALHKDIDDQERASADDTFELDAEATTFLTHQGLLKEEVDFASKYMAGSVWGTTNTGVASTPGAGQFLQWSDGDSTPIEDVGLASEIIQTATGRRANKLVLGQRTWNQLKNHPDFVDRIKFSGSSAAPAIVQRQVLAAILEVDEVLVMSAVVNIAKEGQPGNQVFVAGTGALLVHAAKAPARMTPSAGYTFAWRNYLGGTSPTRIKRFRMENIESDRVEIASAYVQQITGAPLGVFFSGAVA